MVDSRGTSFAEAEIAWFTRPTGLAPRPDLAGRRIVLPGYADIHLVDPEGYRRCIPNPTTYNRLFRSWDGIRDEPGIARIALRRELTLATVLIRGDASGRIYLLDEGMKRLIVSHAVMDRYWFSWSLIHVVEQSLVDRIRSAADWT